MSRCDGQWHDSETRRYLERVAEDQRIERFDIVILKPQTTDHRTGRLYTNDPSKATQVSVRKAGPAASPNPATSGGGSYAPMMPPWSQSTLETGTDLYWNLSLWSDYSVILMRTDLTKV